MSGSSATPRRHDRGAGVSGASWHVILSEDLFCRLGDVLGRIAADERLVVAYDVAVWNI